MGRSSQNDVVHWTPFGTATVTLVEEDYVSPQLFDPYPQSQLHTQWPGVSIPFWLEARMCSCSN
jgi:hypothetical protein